MNINWMDWKLWLIVAISVVSIFLYNMYPQTKQDASIITQYEQSAGVIVVVYEMKDLETAKIKFSQEYPEYEILETFVSKENNKVYIKAKKVKK